MAMKLHKWRDVRDGKLTPAQVAKSDAWVRRELLAMELREMREMAGMTQAETAKASAIAQGDISRLEREGGDRLLSTLRRYVEALGGEIEIVATFGNRRIRLKGV